MTNPTPHGQVPAIQRYKIGYHSDDWGMRSSTPSGIPDDAGAWVRYEDHAAQIAALRAQQPAPATQAQAVAVPLTDGQVESLLYKYGYDPDDEHMAAMLKEAHGIKGGQHGVE